MIINDKQQQLLMEARDIDYILPQYIRSYMYYLKGADPVEIVFPMFSSVPHPTKPGVRVPITWVPEVSVEARTIAEDGSNVPEATEAEVAEKDRLEEENKRLKEQLAALTAAQNIGEGGRGGGPDSNSSGSALGPVGQAVVAEIDRGGPDRDSASGSGRDSAFGPGSGARPVGQSVSGSGVALDSDRAPRQPEHPATGSPDMMHPRGKGDLKQVKADLQPEPDIDESKQKPYSKKVSRKASGEPLVEDTISEVEE